MPDEIKLRLEHISKAFPGVQALDDVSIAVKKGTVHAIVGENGAGKSTLMQIINGAIAPDTGSIRIDGIPVEIRTPKAAEELGISMIWQELQFVSDLTVQENLFINKHPLIPHTPFIDWKRITKEADEILAQEDLALDPKMRLSEISISDIQLLEIIKATRLNAQIIIMDEPTSSLTQHETERLFEKIVRLRNEGRTILYISHKMEEIFRLSNNITIMRDGQIIDTFATSSIDRDDVITMMVGRKLENIYPKRQPNIGERYFEVRNLCCKRRYQNISFSVRSGEIVGFAGLVGAGRTEIMRGICGLDTHDSGEILLHGHSLNTRTVMGAVQAGVMMATEDRRRYGLIPVRSVRENITLAGLGALCLGPFINKKREREQAGKFFERMRIKAPGLETPTYTLSGGNQQKVVLAKWLMANPQLFIMDEPTRGIDVGAKYEIYNIMNELATAGIGIVMISSELPELLGMCDRIYVICEGVVAGELESRDFSQEKIMRLATGGR